MITTKEEKEILIQAAQELKEKTGQQAARGFRVLIAGKGGVGKTTITAILSHLFARRGFSPLAIDEDPQLSLPYALGVPLSDIVDLKTLSNQVYGGEMTGDGKSDSGIRMLQSLTPEVSDLVDRFGITGPDGVNILAMGTVHRAETGCLCPENTLLDAIMYYTTLQFGR